MSRHDEISEVQIETLGVIRWYKEKNGYPPTRSELATLFAVQPNAIQCRLKSMQRKGIIDLVPGIARGIKIKDPW